MSKTNKGSALIDLVIRQPRPREYVYKETPQGPLSLHVQFPPGWRKDDQRPAAVFFFGGGWSGGTPDHFLRQATYLANRGLVTVRPDYRTESRHGTTPWEAVEDARSAFRWLRSQADTLGIDPARLAGGGGSAGAHLAACAALPAGPDVADEDATVSCRPDLLLLFNPALDMIRFLDRMADPDSAEDRARVISPVYHVSAELPATIMFFGCEDRLLEGGRRFAVDAAKVGLRADLYLAEGVGHGFFNHAPWTEATMAKTDAFLAEMGYLDGAPRIRVPDAPLIAWRP